VGRTVDAASAAADGTTPGSASWWRSTLCRDLIVFAAALAILISGSVVLGPGLDEDAYAYLLWGRDLLRGDALNKVTTTAPKPIPMAVATLAHLAPGERGAEFAFAAVTVGVGAGLALLVARLAERAGGGAARWLAVPLLLGNVTYLLYVVNGQSTIYASLFVVGALVVCTRERATTRDYLWAAVLVFGAGLCRPETAVLGAALGLAVYLRLGWRRLGVPALIVAIAMSSVAVNLLLYKVAFGSFTYTSDLALQGTIQEGWKVPDPFVGFAKQLVRTTLYFANRSWALLFVAAVGAASALTRRRWARFAALLLFPPATVAFTWLLVFRGILFNVRCFHYVGALLAVLAAAGVARLAAWAASSGEFLDFLGRRWSAVAFTLLVFGSLAPAFLGRPLPTQRRDFCERMDAACAVLKPKLEGQDSPRIVAWDLVQVVYRIGLPPDKHFRFIDRVLQPDQATPPWDAEWFVVERAHQGGHNPPLPTEWGGRLVWQDPSGQTRVYHCDKHARNQEPSSTPGTVR